MGGSGLGFGGGGSSFAAAQPTGFSPSVMGAGVNGVGGAGAGGLTPFGGPGASSVGVGLRPQATGVGLGAANPFRASSVMTPPGSVNGNVGAFPAFGSASNVNAGAGLFLQPTGAPSFGQSLFMGAQTDTSKQANGAAQLI
jgi:hypothetical protein